MPGLREKQKREREHRIIEAAIELFTVKGFNETTMEEIAEKAEVGVGTLYNYVKSKGGLLLFIITERTEDLYKEAEEIVSSPGTDVLVGINRLITVYLKGFISLPQNMLRHFFSVIFLQQNSEGGLERHLIQLDYKLINQLRELLELYKSMNMINAELNTEVLAFNIYSLVIMQYTATLVQEEISFEALLAFVKIQIEQLYNGFKP